MIAAGLPEATVVRREGAAEWQAIRSHAPFALAMSTRAPLPVTPARPAQPAPQSYRWALFAGIGVAVGGGAIIAAVSLAKPSAGSVAPTPEPPRQPVAVVPPKPVTPAERAAAAKTLPDVLGVAVPLMADIPGQASDGTRLLISWMAQRAAWKDLDVNPGEVTYGQARKEIDAARGKRLCVSGLVIQIRAEPYESGKIFTGLLRNTDGNLFNFIAVRSSGAIEGDGIARFCGVLTELYDYRNSGGGTGHAVTVVGMFDLPENRK